MNSDDRHLPSRRQLKVFIASPNDLAVERRLFKDTLDGLNRGFGRGADVEFVPVGWEDALSQVGRRPQGVIDLDVDACDLFFLVMWRRWGQRAPDAKPYSSYTEEEFYRALTRFERTGKPSIFVLFKHLDPGQIVDAGPQLKKVLQFRKKLEKSRTVLYRSFADEKSFVNEVDLHLTGFVKNPPELHPPKNTVPILPDSVALELLRHKKASQRALFEIEALRQQAQHSLTIAEKAQEAATDSATKSRAAAVAADAKLSTRTLALAELAAKAALDGRVEEARQSFASAVDDAASLRVLYLAFEFFFRIGEIGEAERILKRSLAVSGADSQTDETAAVINNLGTIAMSRGELEEATRLFEKSLRIYQLNGNKVGEADCLSNLGLISRHFGNVEKAESQHRQALEVYKAAQDEIGQASSLVHLALAMRDHGQLTEAESFYRDALEIHRRLNLPDLVAIDYGNLGNLARMRGDLDWGTKFHREALEISKKTGNTRGQSLHLGNLAVIAMNQGDLEQARQLHSEALNINRSLGNLESQAANLCNLGIIARRSDDLDLAEHLSEEAATIDRQLGNASGLAISLSNLGQIARARGALDAAEALHREALAIELRTERLEGQADQLAHLGSVQEQRGDGAETRRLWTEARNIYEHLGMELIVAQLNEWLSALDTVTANPPHAGAGQS